MTEKIISNGMIKTLLGISGSAEDAVIDTMNRTCTELLWDFIGVDSLVSQAVSGERVKLFNSEYWVPRIFPIDLSETITLVDWNGNTITGFTFGQDDQDFRRVNFLDSSGNRTFCGYEEFYASYTAGYTRQQTVTVADYASLVGKTISAYVAGELTEYSFVSGTPASGQIQASVSNDQTAANIAGQLAGSSSGAVATLPLGTYIELGTATAAMLTITDATMPESLRHCVAFLVSGIMAQRQKSKAVKEYTIGQKKVVFADNADADFVRETIQQFASRYRDIPVYST
jgi:hypothetical protein